MIEFGSLFTGIGGFDIGFQRAGMVCKWQCEIDRLASGVLERQFPGVKNYYHGIESINYRTGKGYRRYEKPEPVGLVCGGFPCQDVSIAGRRAGLAGKRSGLWFEFHRVIEQTLPRWVVIENVPGLLSSNKGRDFAVILRGLVKLGYGVAWRVLDAQYFGVAQRRRRVFIVASLGNGSAAQILFEREGSEGNTPPSRETGQEITGTLDGKSASSDRGSQSNEAEFLTVARPLRAQAQSSHREDSDTFVTIDWQASGSRGFSVNDKPSLVTDKTPAVVGALSAHDKKHGHAMSTQQAAESNQLVSFALNGKNGKRYDGENETFVAFTQEQEPKFGEIPGTLGTYNGRKAGDASLTHGVRRLTPTESERLQGFPDGWTDGQSDSARYRQLGNAVCVPVIEWLGNRIVTVDNLSQKLRI